MASLSITEAWNETSAFARREGQILFPIAFLLMALPGTILQAFIPQQPGAEPEAGAWMLLILPVMLISLYGYLVICWMGVRRSGEAGAAFSAALTRFLPALGAVLLVIVGMMVLMIPVFLLIGGGALLAGDSGAAGGGSVVLGVILVFAVMLVLATRFMVFYPVAAAEPVGPIGILRRSWDLTSGYFWKLLGFLILIFILFAVLGAVVGMVFGLLIFAVAGTPEPGSISSFLVLLVGAVVNAFLVTLFAVLISRIYVQLSGRGADVAEVF